MKRRLLTVALLLASALSLQLPAAENGFRSQWSGWFSLNDDSPSTPRCGLRWQPSLSLAMPLGGDWRLDGEFALDASAMATAPGWRSTDIDSIVDPYRLWLRLSSQRFEARLGLQKINFGSAMLFRPLMWFDRLDPRDPLQLSAGVWGLLLRGYFRGNANAWLWGLYGNDKTKGWETEPTAVRTPEFGGRLQVPLLAGEAAATAHFRRVDVGSHRAGESRFALDGKWDVGIGLWVETALNHRPQRAATPATPSWQRALTVGLDYTFALGNGLYVLAEQFFTHDATSTFGHGAGGTTLTALSSRYPLGLLDSLSAILYHDWQAKQLYSFATWQRTTDHWQFHIMAFCNPKRPLAVQDPAASASFADGGPQVPAASASFAGWGIQLLAVWNI